MAAQQRLADTRRAAGLPGRTVSLKDVQAQRSQAAATRAQQAIAASRLKQQSADTARAIRNAGTIGFDVPKSSLVDPAVVKTQAEKVAAARATMKALASKTRQGIETKIKTQREAITQSIKSRVAIQRQRQNGRLAAQRANRLGKLVNAQRAAGAAKIQAAGPQLRLARKTLEGAQGRLSDATATKNAQPLAARQGELVTVNGKLDAAKKLKPDLEGVRNDAGASRTDANSKGADAGARAAAEVPPIKDTNAALNAEGPKLAALKDGIGGKMETLGGTQGRLGDARTDAANSSGLAKQAGINAGTKASEAVAHLGNRDTQHGAAGDAARLQGEAGTKLQGKQGELANATTTHAVDVKAVRDAAADGVTASKTSLDGQAGLVPTRNGDVDAAVSARNNADTAVITNGGKLTGAETARPGAEAAKTAAGDAAGANLAQKTGLQGKKETGDGETPGKEVARDSAGDAAEAARPARDPADAGATARLGYIRDTDIPAAKQSRADAADVVRDRGTALDGPGGLRSQRVDAATDGGKFGKDITTTEGLLGTSIKNLDQAKRVLGNHTILRNRADGLAKGHGANRAGALVKGDIARATLIARGRITEGVRPGAAKPPGRSAANALSAAGRRDAVDQLGKSGRSKAGVDIGIAGGGLRLAGKSLFGAREAGTKAGTQKGVAGEALGTARQDLAGVNGTLAGARQTGLPGQKVIREGAATSAEAARLGGEGTAAPIRDAGKGVQDTGAALNSGGRNKTGLETGLPGKQTGLGKTQGDLGGARTDAAAAGAAATSARTKAAGEAGKAADADGGRNTQDTAGRDAGAAEGGARNKQAGLEGDLTTAKDTNAAAIETIRSKAGEAAGALKTDLGREGGNVTLREGNVTDAKNTRDAAQDAVDINTGKLDGADGRKPAAGSAKDAAAAARDANGAVRDGLAVQKEGGDAQTPVKAGDANTAKDAADGARPARPGSDGVAKDRRDQIPPEAAAAGASRQAAIGAKGGATTGRQGDTQKLADAEEGAKQNSENTRITDEKIAAAAKAIDSLKIELAGHLKNRGAADSAGATARNLWGNLAARLDLSMRLSGIKRPVADTRVSIPLDPKGKTFDADRGLAAENIRREAGNVQRATNNTNTAAKNVVDARTTADGAGKALAGAKTTLDGVTRLLNGADGRLPDLIKTRNDADTSATKADGGGKTTAGPIRESGDGARDTRTELDTAGTVRDGIIDGISGKQGALGGTRLGLDAARTDAGKFDAEAKAAGNRAATEAGKAGAADAGRQTEATRAAEAAAAEGGAGGRRGALEGDVTAAKDANAGAIETIRNNAADAAGNLKADLGREGGNVTLRDGDVTAATTTRDSAQDAVDINTGKLDGADGRKPAAETAKNGAGSQRDANGAVRDGLAVQKEGGDAQTPVKAGDANTAKDAADGARPARPGSDGVAKDRSDQIPSEVSAAGASRLAGISAKGNAGAGRLGATQRLTEAEANAKQNGNDAAETARLKEVALKNLEAAKNKLGDLSAKQNGAAGAAATALGRWAGLSRQGDLAGRILGLRQGGPGRVGPSALPPRIPENFAGNRLLAANTVREAGGLFRQAEGAAGKAGRNVVDARLGADTAGTARNGAGGRLAEIVGSLPGFRSALSRLTGGRNGAGDAAGGAKTKGGDAGGRAADAADGVRRTGDQLTNTGAQKGGILSRLANLFGKRNKTGADLGGVRAEAGRLADAARQAEGIARQKGKDAEAADTGRQNEGKAGDTARDAGARAGGRLDGHRAELAGAKTTHGAEVNTIRSDADAAAAKLAKELGDVDGSKPTRDSDVDTARTNEGDAQRNVDANDGRLKDADGRRPDAERAALDADAARKANEGNMKDLDGTKKAGDGETGPKRNDAEAAIKDAEGNRPKDSDADGPARDGPNRPDVQKVRDDAADAAKKLQDELDAARKKRLEEEDAARKNREDAEKARKLIEDAEALRRKNLEDLENLRRQKEGSGTSKMTHFKRLGGLLGLLGILYMMLKPAGGLEDGEEEKTGPSGASGPGEGASGPGPGGDEPSGPGGPPAGPPPGPPTVPVPYDIPAFEDTDYKDGYTAGLRDGKRDGFVDGYKDGVKDARALFGLGGGLADAGPELAAIEKYTDAEINREIAGLSKAADKEFCDTMRSTAAEDGLRVEEDFPECATAGGSRRRQRAQKGGAAADLTGKSGEYLRGYNDGYKAGDDLGYAAGYALGKRSVKYPPTPADPPPLPVDPGPSTFEEEDFGEELGPEEEEQEAEEEAAEEEEQEAEEEEEQEAEAEAETPPAINESVGIEYKPEEVPVVAPLPPTPTPLPPQPDYVFPIRYDNSPPTMQEGGGLAPTLKAAAAALGPGRARASTLKRARRLLKRIEGRTTGQSPP